MCQTLASLHSQAGYNEEKDCLSIKLKKLKSFAQFNLTQIAKTGRGKAR
jgi:hypothetical protein